MELDCAAVWAGCNAGRGGDAAAGLLPPTSCLLQLAEAVAVVGMPRPCLPGCCTATQHVQPCWPALPPQMFKPFMVVGTPGRLAELSRDGSLQTHKCAALSSAWNALLSAGLWIVPAGGSLQACKRGQRSSVQYQRAALPLRESRLHMRSNRALAPHSKPPPGLVLQDGGADFGRGGPAAGATGGCSCVALAFAPSPYCVVDGADQLLAPQVRPSDAC